MNKHLHVAPFIKKDEVTLSPPCLDLRDSMVGWNCKFGFPMYEGMVPFEENCFSLYSPNQSVGSCVTMADEASPSSKKSVEYDSWDELRVMVESPRLLVSPKANDDDSTNDSVKSAGNGSKMLTREIIAQYYYMPITEAAKHLNVGLTLLKKRCRELGIQRWPHRKLMSLQTLIKNIQEMSNQGHGDEEKLKEAIEVLEKEKRELEESPDTQLEAKTKRLRQACFKANYKKRKSMATSNTFDMGSLLRLPSIENGTFDMASPESSTFFDPNTVLDDDDEFTSLIYSFTDGFNC